MRTRPFTGSSGRAHRLAAAAVAAIIGGAVTPDAISPAAAASGGASTPSSCSVSALASASPSIVPVGGVVNVRYRLLFHCPQRPRPYALYMVAATADPGDERPLPIERLSSVADALSIEANRFVKAGLASFGVDSGEWCTPSSNAAAFRDCLDAFSRRGQTSPILPAPDWDMAAAIRHATERLVAARRGVGGLRAFDPSREGMLILADAPEGRSSCQEGGACTATCDAAKSAADDAVAAGIDVGVLCLSGHCATSCLAGMASPGSYYTAREWPGVLDHMQKLAWSSELRVARTSVRDILASNMEVNTASFDPDDAIYRPLDKSVQWLDHPVNGRWDISFAYATTPTAPGTSAVSAFGSVSIVDTVGLTRSFRLPSRSVAAADKVSRVYSPFLLVNEMRILPLSR